MGDDYLISLDPLISHSRWVRGPSDDWTCLGAFDYEGLPRNERRLRFFTAAEQAECIPMLTDKFGSSSVRQSARRPQCR